LIFINNNPNPRLARGFFVVKGVYDFHKEKIRYAKYVDG